MILDVNSEVQEGVNNLHLQSTDLQHGCQENMMGKTRFFQWMMLGHSDNHIQKNEAGPLHHTIYKN